MDPKLLSLIAALASMSAMTADQAVAHLRTLNDSQRAALAETYGEGGADKIATLLKPSPTTVAAPAKQADADDPDMEFLRGEQLRQKNIRSLAGSMATGLAANVAAIITHAGEMSVAENLTLAQSRQKIQTAMAAALKPIEPGGTATIDVSEDANVASLRVAIPQALMLRANPDIDTNKFEEFEKREALDKSRNNIVVSGRQCIGKVHERAYQLRHTTMLGMYRSYLKALGAPLRDLEDMDKATLANLMGPRALRQRFPKMALLAESTSDFANITYDAINKSLRFMYLDAKRTWDIWAQRQTNPDFKFIHRVVLSEAPDMVSSVEGREISYVAMTDSKESYQLAEYKSGIKLTRRVIINDDLSALSQIPRQQANSAARKEDDVAYAILTGNAAMADTGLLFNATVVSTAGGHGNYGTTGTAITISSLQTSQTAIKKQKGLGNAARLELEPKFLLVPTSIEESTKQLIGSENILIASSGGLSAAVGNKNPFQNRYRVVGSTRLDDVSTVDWYHLADYRDGQVNTIEVCFLEGEPEPVLKQETDFDTDDVKYLVRHTVAAKAIDFRGLRKQVGA